MSSKEKNSNVVWIVILVALLVASLFGGFGNWFGLKVDQTPFSQADLNAAKTTAPVSDKLYSQAEYDKAGPAAVETFKTSEIKRIADEKVIADTKLAAEKQEYEKLVVVTTETLNLTANPGEVIKVFASQVVISGTDFATKDRNTDMYLIGGRLDRGKFYLENLVPGKSAYRRFRETGTYDKESFFDNKDFSIIVEENGKKEVYSFAGLVNKNRQDGEIVLILEYNYCDQKQFIKYSDGRPPKPEPTYYASTTDDDNGTPPPADNTDSGKKTTTDTGKKTTNDTTTTEDKSNTDNNKGTTPTTPTTTHNCFLAYYKNPYGAEPYKAPDVIPAGYAISGDVWIRSAKTLNIWVRCYDDLAETSAIIFLSCQTEVYNEYGFSRSDSCITEAELIRLDIGKGFLKENIKIFHY